MSIEELDAWERFDRDCLNLAQEIVKSLPVVVDLRTDEFRGLLAKKIFEWFRPLLVQAVQGTKHHAQDRLSNHQNVEYRATLQRILRLAAGVLPPATVRPALETVPGKPVDVMRLERLEAAAREAYKQLVNLQPHIPQACYPGHEQFIDTHVDLALEALGQGLDIEGDIDGRDKLPSDSGD